MQYSCTPSDVTVSLLSLCLCFSSCAFPLASFFSFLFFFLSLPSLPHSPTFPPSTPFLLSLPSSFLLPPSSPFPLSHPSLPPILSLSLLLHLFLLPSSSTLSHSISSPSVLLPQQAVDIHKEKVARREIGTLASSKNIARAQKVVAPTQKERPQKFVRQRMDFSSLDHIGHGVKVTDSTKGIDERYGKEVGITACFSSL